MFTNIGGKIKTATKVFCGLAIALSVFLALGLFASDETVPGVILLIVGPLTSWLGSFVLYGFGELVENSCIQTNLMIKQDMEKK